MLLSAVEPCLKRGWTATGLFVEHYQKFQDPANGKGGILNVVNDTGGSSTIANPDVPVTVVSYP
jgi:hypothetical protein